MANGLTNMSPKGNIWKIEDRVSILKEAGFIPEAINYKSADSSRTIRSVVGKYGISTSTLYEWKKRFIENGLEGLRAKPPIRITPPPSLPEEIKRSIIQMSKRNPQMGCKAISAQMRRQGKQVSHTAVQKILSLVGRATRRDRGLRPA